MQSIQIQQSKNEFFSVLEEALFCRHSSRKIPPEQIFNAGETGSLFVRRHRKLFGKKERRQSVYSPVQRKEKPLQQCAVFRHLVFTCHLVCSFRSTSLSSRPWASWSYCLRQQDWMDYRRFVHAVVSAFSGLRLAKTPCPTKKCSARLPNCKKCTLGEVKFR